MYGNIDKVLEALETLCESLELALARLGVCGQGDGADHKADVDSLGGTSALIMGRRAISALSAIDPEAIRAEVLREAADRAVSWQVKLCSRDDWHCEGCTECNQLRYAILSAEPAQDDGKPESEESRDERLATKQLLGAGCHDECGDLPEEDR